MLFRSHLDLESREALEAALEAFPGTVLLVSHDRAVLDAVAERTVAIEDRGLRSYEGGWADLVRTRATEAGAVPPPEPTPTVVKPQKPRPTRTRPTQLQLVEARIGELERHVAGLEQKLAVDWTDMDTLTAHRAARDELQSLLAEWEVLFEAEQEGDPQGAAPATGAERPLAQ